MTNIEFVIFARYVTGMVQRGHQICYIELFRGKEGPKQWIIVFVMNVGYHPLKALLLGSVPSFVNCLKIISQNYKLWSRA